MDRFGKDFVRALIDEDLEAFKELTLSKSDLIATIQEKSPESERENLIQSLSRLEEDAMWKDNKKRLEHLFEQKKKITGEIVYVKVDFLIDKRDSKQIGFDVGEARVWFYITGTKGVHYIHVDKMFESVNGWLCGEIGLFKTPGQSPAAPFLEEELAQPQEEIENEATEEVEEESEREEP